MLLISHYAYNNVGGNYDREFSMCEEKIKKYTKEYGDLWKERNLVLNLSPDSPIDSFFKLTSNISRKIADYFEKIKLIETKEKWVILNKLKEFYNTAAQDDSLFDQILKSNLPFEKLMLRYCIKSYYTLTNEVKKIEYELKMEPDKCNCILKQNLELKIYEQPAKSVTLIQSFSTCEGFYEYELHQCKECNAFWINDLYEDDGPPKGWRKPENDDDFKIIKEYSENL